MDQGAGSDRVSRVEASRSGMTESYHRPVHPENPPSCFDNPPPGLSRHAAFTPSRRRAVHRCDPRGVQQRFHFPRSSSNSDLRERASCRIRSRKPLAEQLADRLGEVKSVFQPRIPVAIGIAFFQALDHLRHALAKQPQLPPRKIPVDEIVRLIASRKDLQLSSFSDFCGSSCGLRAASSSLSSIFPQRTDNHLRPLFRPITRIFVRPSFACQRCFSLAAEAAPHSMPVPARIAIGMVHQVQAQPNAQPRFHNQEAVVEQADRWCHWSSATMSMAEINRLLIKVSKSDLLPKPVTHCPRGFSPQRALSMMKTPEKKREPALR